MLARTEKMNIAVSAFFIMLSDDYNTAINMRLIEALEQGRMKLWGEPDKVIETAISKLFFFGNHVVKVYKHEDFFFANLEEVKTRRKFYEDDFFWNHTASPNIYLELKGVRADSLSDARIADGHDFYILMNKIDGSATLTRLLAERKISVAEIKYISRELIKLTRRLTKKRLKSFSHLTSKGWRYLWLKNEVDSLRPWLAMAKKYIAPSEVEKMIKVLVAASKKEKYFSGYDNKCLTVVVDNNCDNLLWLDGQPGFIDIMPPMEGWRVADEYATVVRTAVDAYVIGGREYGQVVYDTYRQFRDDVPDNIRKIYEVRAALIQWSYRHLVGQHRLAEKYRKFILPRLEQLKKG